MSDERDERPMESAVQRRRSETDEIGIAIKALRAERGWSLRKLAEEAGVSASLLSAVETGKIVPTVSSLFAVSDALGQPAQSLFPVGRRQAVTARSPGPQDPVQEAGETSASESRPLDPPAIQPAPRATVAEEANLKAQPTPPLRTQSPGTEAAARPSRRQIGSPRRRSVRPAVRIGSPGADTEEIALPEPAPAPPVVEPGPISELAPHDPAAPPVPGFSIVRSGDRPAITLDDGTTWSLVSRTLAGPATVIDVAMGPGSRFPSRYRTHAHPVELTIVSGHLLAEGGFSRMDLSEGDAVTIDEGVPHRLGTGSASGCRFLMTAVGSWDGRI